MSSLHFDSSLLAVEQFQCSICLDVFTDPVTTPCGHNFCKACIGGQWDSSEICQCPKCSKRFYARPEVSTNSVIEEISVEIKRRKLIPPECIAAPGEVACDVCTGRKLKALKSCLVCLTSYCETHLEPHQRVLPLKRHELIDPVDNLEDRMCKKHQRLLELFCRSDQTCVCVLCTETDHKCHNAVPVDEEAAHQKFELEITILEVQNMIQDRLAKVEEIKHSVELSRKNTSKEIEDSEKLFTALMCSVEETQASLKKALEEMQVAAESRADGLINELEEEVTELQRRSTELEQLSHTEDHLHLLQNLQTICAYPPAKDWSEISVYIDLCVGTVRGAVSQLVKTLKREMTTLTHMELKRMRAFKEVVTLDSNTANCALCLSDGGKRIKHSKVDKVMPDNPERFDIHPMVLGERGFNSGRHYWEVKVGLRNNWAVGVALATVARKEPIKENKVNGFFALRKSGFDYKTLYFSSKILYLNPRPREIGVYVDYEKGQVSFYDVEEKSHIFSFTRQSFTEKLYPYFYVYSNAKRSEALVISCMADPVASRVTT